MDESWLRILAVVLAVLQAIVLILGLKRADRVGSWLVWICPVILIGCWLSGVASNRSWRYGQADTIFLVFDVPALLASLVLLFRKGRSRSLFWSAWFLDLVLCSGFVYMAFFFRLQF